MCSPHFSHVMMFSSDGKMGGMDPGIARGPGGGFPTALAEAAPESGMWEVMVSVLMRSDMLLVLSEIPGVPVHFELFKPVADESVYSMALRFELGIILTATSTIIVYSRELLPAQHEFNEGTPSRA